MVRLTVSVDPPPKGQLFFIFVGVLLTLYYDYMCSETDFTQEKSIFIQLLESPIPSLTAAALRMIICKRPAPHFDNQEKSMKNAFLRLLTMR